MENQDLAILVLLVAAVLNITVLVLFIRLCGRVKYLLEGFMLVHGLEEGQAYDVDGNYRKCLVKIS
jgi:hypothetical protein